MKDLEEIRKKLDIESFEKLTNDQMTKILELHGKCSITIGQLEQIAKIAPHFASVASAAAKSVTEVAKVAAASQQSALAEVGKTRDAILSLASHPKITEQTLYLIVEKLSELAKQLERMNESNNSLFSKAKNVLAVFGMVMLGLLSVGAAVQGRDRP